MAGSVSTNQGTVTRGNSGGDTNVGVSVGTLDPGRVIVISYDVTVNVGIATGSTLSNQGQVQYDTDGDGTARKLRSPATAIRPRPAASHHDGGCGRLAHGAGDQSVDDLNGGNLEPGDLLRYTVALQNTSAFNATGIEFAIPFPPTPPLWTIVFPCPTAAV